MKTIWRDLVTEPDLVINVAVQADFSLVVSLRFVSVGVVVEATVFLEACSTLIMLPFTR